MTDSFFSRLRPHTGGPGRLAIDDVDDRLIAALSETPRASSAAIGDRIGLTRSSVRLRIKRLLDDGVIAITGVADPRIAGLGVIELVGVRVTGDPSAVADRLAEIDDAYFVVEVAGPFDVLVELHCSDSDRLAATLRAIRTIDGVRSLDAWSVLESLMQRWDGRPIVTPDDRLRSDDVARLDDVDLQLLDLLQADGRATYSELGRQVGLSPSVTRVRVQRLIESRAVQITVMPGVAAIDEVTHIGALLEVDGPLEPAVRSAAEMQETTVVHIQSGRHPIGIEAWATDLAHLRDLLERLRHLPGVTAVQSLLYLRAARLIDQGRSPQT